MQQWHAEYRKHTKRLTFTEARRGLVGDVTALKRIFDFLDKWQGR